MPTVQVANWLDMVPRYIFQAIPFVGVVAAGVILQTMFRSEAESNGFEGELLAITPAEAKDLKFPVSHPRKKLVYIGHPLDAATYVPVANFHTFLFEHKVAEALRLIRSLGADSVTILRIAGWEQTAGVHVKAPVEGVDVGSSANENRSAQSYIETTMKLKPTADPHIPEDLLWFAHEPLWRELADARLEAGMTSFELEVRTSDDYGVNAGLKVMVEKVGLDIGGEFVKHQTTVWRLKGTFANGHV